MWGSDFPLSFVPRVIVGNVSITGALSLTGAAAVSQSLTLTEMTAPDAPAANKATIYLVDNEGSTEAYIKFANGNSTKLADDTA